jgi:solute carrier family 50 protein (sugar transporter)
MIILVCVGWLGFANGHEQNIVGLLVNINLLFFYGAPLQTMKTVINEKSSDSIHAPTMIMNWFNTSFWALYGLAKLDPVIYLPNMVGLFLGIAQGVLCLLYPRRVAPDLDMEPLLQDAGDEAGEAEDQIHSSQDSAEVLL